MGVNLLRNARVFFTTNVNADTGKINTTASSGTSSNTFEIQVLDGFSFSQGTTAETVTLNEAGATPVRGQRSFNTALDPVDFSFSTYLRPCDSNETTTGGFVTSEERCLWNAMFSSKAIGTTGAAWLERTASSVLTYTIAAGSGYSVAGTYYSVPLVMAAGTGGTALSSVALVTDSLVGEFTCTSSSLNVGQLVYVTGTIAGGTIAGYTTGTNYYIIATNGTTSFQLSATLGGTPITTNGTSPTGLTFTLGPKEQIVADITVLGGAVTTVSSVNAGTGAVVGMVFTAPNTALGGSGSGFTATVATVSTTTTNSPAKVVTNYSQVHQLQKFGMIIVFDDTTFFIENCTLDTATIDFGLDAIATIAWTGKATTLTTPATTVTFGGTPSSSTGGTMAGGYSATSFKPKITYAPYIANKLSTMTLKSSINAESGTSKTYTLALTGGNITISNNVTYLTPANLGIVNQPCTYFTGTRSITGNVTAYLRGGSGANFTSTLLADMLSSSNITDVNPAYELVIAMGGASNATRVEFDLSAAVVQIPTIATEQVISTTINFTAQGYTQVSGATDTFDITESNELEVRYYAPIA